MKIIFSMENVLMLNVTANQKTAIKRLYHSFNWEFQNIVSHLEPDQQDTLFQIIAKNLKFDVADNNQIVQTSTDDKDIALETETNEYVDKVTNFTESVSGGLEDFQKIQENEDANDLTKNTHSGIEEDSCDYLTKFKVTKQSQLQGRNNEQEIHKSSIRNRKREKSAPEYSSSEEPDTSDILREVCKKIETDRETETQNCDSSTGDEDKLNTNVENQETKKLRKRKSPKDGSGNVKLQSNKKQVTLKGNLKTFQVKNKTKVLKTNKKDKCLPTRSRKKVVENKNKLKRDCIKVEEDAEGQEIECNTSKKKRYNCKQCDYVNNTLCNLEKHKEAVHLKTAHPCSKCDKTLKSYYDAKQHEKLVHISPLKCDKCDKKFTSRSGLFNHNRTQHLKSFLYKCDECNARFLYKNHYVGHMNKHSKEKSYSCSKCSKPFCYSSTKLAHERKCFHGQYVEKKEPDNRKVLCDLCGDELAHNCSLKTHYKFVHSNEPKSKCEECGKTFKGIYSLQRHTKIAHGEGKDVTLPCEICGQTFNQIQVLRQHVRRHKQEYSVFCSTCDKGFYSNYKLKQHELVHTGDKPHTCPVCLTFKCATKPNLNKHIKSHERRKKDPKARKSNKKTNKTKALTKESTVYPNDPNSEKDDVHKEVNKDIVHAKVNDSIENNVSNINSNMSQDGYQNGNVTNMGYRAQLVLHNDHGQGMLQQVTEAHGAHMTGSEVINMHSNHGIMQMSTNNDMIRYDHLHYSHEGLVNHSDGHFDSRLHGNSYYDNNHSNQDEQIPEGLNILTVAMNLVNPEPYQ